jgi:Glycosyl hydrolases family 2, sugar binding domain/Glycosyl hydrolases family 2/Glycosyl hydrolases family 2, TIM barrel domain
MHRRYLYPAILLLVLSASARAADPRPVAVGLERKEVIPLAGDWHFQEDPNAGGEHEGWFRGGRIVKRTARIPLPWQLALPELRDYAGPAWYERTVHIPASAAGKRMILASFGISDLARIWINGAFAGEHRGAQSPFGLDISKFVRVGADNTVAIEATDPQGSFMDGQSLIRRSGLWQDLWIEITSRTFVGDVFMVPNVDQSIAEARLTIASEPSARLHQVRLNVAVQSDDGQEFRGSTVLHLESDHASVRIPVHIATPRLWELDAPHMYHATVTLTDGAKTVDEVATDFGMRKIEARAGRIYLNDKPIYICGGGMDPVAYGGAVDVNWMVPPPYHDRTDEEIKRDIVLTKSMGVNLVRIPLRPAPPRLLYWADRLGLLVWQGEPWTLSQPVKNAPAEYYEKGLTEIMLRDRNHPSLAMWELVNESGGFKTREAFLDLEAKLYAFAKSMDETRLILDNSGGWALSESNYIGNHGISDIDDVHAYPPFHQFDEARRLIGSVRMRNQRPVLMSEFGSIPYIFDADKARAKWDGTDPWWMTIPAKDYASTVPHQGYEERFRRWKLDRVFGDMHHFTEATDWNYFDSLKHQTELMRINPEITGFVAWLFDTAPHPVGAIDYYGEKKAFADQLASVWRQDSIVLDIAGRRSYWSGETVRADVYVSHFGQSEPLSGEVRWSLDTTGVQGKLGAVTVVAGKGQLVGRVELPAPEVGEGRTLRLRAELTSGGQTVASNYVTIRVFPPSYRTPKVKSIGVYGPLAWRFAVLGYEVTSSPSVPIVATKADEQLLKTVEDGRTAILLVGPDWVPGAPHLIERALDPTIVPFLRRFKLSLALKEQGGHADTFYVKRDRGLFDRIPFNNPMGWGFESVWPRYVVGGIDSNRESDLLAGAFGNMIRSHSLDADGNWYGSEVNGTLFQVRYGKGRLIISTFDLLEKFADDPVASIMLNDLVSYSAGAFEPAWQLQ